MNRDLEVLTLLLLDPCLTTDEAAREAAARMHTAAVVSETRTQPHSRERKIRRGTHTPANEGPAVGF
jgi:hypothetical protein